MEEIIKPVIPISNTGLLSFAGQKRIFGVVQTIHTGTAKTQLHYEVEVVFIDKRAECRHYAINRKQVYVNEQVPDTMLEKLADSCGALLFPLHIAVDAENKIIEILNASVIKEKWITLKPTLQQYYVGDTAESIITNIDNTYNHPDQLQHHVQNDWFLKIFFAPVYRALHTKADIEGIMHYPLLPFSMPIKYLVTISADKYADDINKFNIAVKGNCNDERSAADVLFNRPVPLEKHFKDTFTPLKGSVDIIYRYYHHDGSLFSITGNAGITLPNNQTKTIQIEIYHLIEKDPPKTSQTFNVFQ